jgi:exodeoxyribonuclease III
MRILTWNINSVRLRLPLLKKLVKERQPDIICLQETKTRDEFFPITDITKMGYNHAHFHGMKSYNGVAILSRLPLKGTEIYHRYKKQDCRHIAVHLESSKFKKKKIEIHCLYIPAGGDEPDAKINDKYAHKLGFVDEMADWFRDTYRPDVPLIALGDFNIAPQEHDVWSHKQLLNVISHTPAEITRLTRMQKSLDWHDVSRHFVPSEEKCYTWWSYRNRDWKKSNRGRRLDHIWVTKPLMPYLKKQEILAAARDWDQPSDHVPVMADIDL